MILVGKMSCINQTSGAIKITVQGKSLDGRDDRTEYLPKSVINIKRAKFGGFFIFVPSWILKKKNINWHRIEEIEPIAKLEDEERSKTWSF